MYISDNYVLVYPDADFTQHNGVEISDVFDPARRWAVTGKVLAVPKRLNFYYDVVRKYERQLMKYPEVTEWVQKCYQLSVEFEQEMIAKVGDRVVFNYIAHADDVVVDVGRERPALLIKWDMLYFIGQKLVNGWLFVEPVEMSQKERQIHWKNLDWLNDEAKGGFGIVRDMGLPVRYMVQDYKDDNSIQIGDKVFFRHTNNVPIEWNMHKILNEGNRAFYKMQRKDILAVIKKNM